MSDETIIDLEDRKAKVKTRVSSRSIEPSQSIKQVIATERWRGMLPGQWPPDEYGLPPDCPVKPLGRDGGFYYFLDVAGGVTILSRGGTHGDAVVDLFSPHTNYAEWAWPRVNKDGKPTGEVAATHAVKALKNAATLKSEKFGAWNMTDRVRGRGAWRDVDGKNIVIHCGAEVFTAEKVLPPGEYGEMLYPKRPSIIGPKFSETAPGDIQHSEELLALFKTWRWARPDLDPLLLLGWVGVAFLGGALDWRPAIFVTGERGTGKTTLQRLIEWVLGGGLITSTDATAAGLYRTLKNDSIAIMLDEMEAKEDDRKARAVIELMRHAASGGVTLRADPNGGGAQFVARSAFYFSGINAPALEAQDLSRLAICSLQPQEAGSKPPEMSMLDWQEHGQDIFARLVKRWGSLSTSIAAFKRVLMAAGHDGRGGDTFGVLAAFAHEMLHDDPPTDEDFGEWIKLLSPKKLNELWAMQSAWRKCLDHLLGAQPEALRHASYKSIGQIIAAWRDKRLTKDSGDLTVSEDERCKTLLKLCGLTMVQPREGGGEGYKSGRLFVPFSHPQLIKIYAGTNWAGAGVWAGALRQIPSALWRSGVAEIDVGKQKGLLIHIAAILDEDDGEDD